jgi:fido (protein-threonine AMPylation protein)
LGIEPVPSSIDAPDVIGAVDVSMSYVTVSMLQLVHEAITECSALPDEVRGSLRGVRVWIGDAKDPTYEPPPPESIVDELVKLLGWWNATYQTLVADRGATVAALARLHYGIAAIHPFVDANGRLARFLVNRAAVELLGRSIARGLTEDHTAYFSALHAADQGDLGPLERLISAALE